jgi:hypothetical protein
MYRYCGQVLFRPNEPASLPRQGGEKMIDRRKRASNAGARCTGIVDKSTFSSQRKGRKKEKKKERRLV